MDQRHEQEGADLQLVAQRRIDAGIRPRVVANYDPAGADAGAGKTLVAIDGRSEIRGGGAGACATSHMAIDFHGDGDRRRLQLTLYFQREIAQYAVGDGLDRSGYGIGTFADRLVDETVTAALGAGFSGHNHVCRRPLSGWGTLPVNL